MVLLYGEASFEIVCGVVSSCVIMCMWYGIVCGVYMFDVVGLYSMVFLCVVSWISRGAE